jgi:hypothetical protein
VKTFNTWLEGKINEMDGVQASAASTTQANLGPQQKSAIAKTIGSELATELTKLRAGGKVLPKKIQGAALQKAMNNPLLKGTPPDQINVGVTQIMNAIPGVKV